jgi:hypothetical protein
MASVSAELGEAEEEAVEADPAAAADPRHRRPPPAVVAGSDKS